MKKVVIMPGGFHPFHSGHYALYQQAVKAFPDADVYVAATTDTSTRPFPFEIKQKLARLAGVPADKFVQVKSPFRSEEITSRYNPNDTALIFVRSEKDRESQPKPGGTKKDGSPAYLQPLSTNIKPMTVHGYMTYLPTIEFGPGITSASQIRAAWPNMDAEQKLSLVTDLYPRVQKNKKLADTVIKMLDAAISGTLTEDKFAYNMFFRVPPEKVNIANKIQEVISFYPTRIKDIWKCSIMRNENLNTVEKKKELLTKVFGPAVKINAQDNAVSQSTVDIHNRPSLKEDYVAEDTSKK